MPLSDRSAGPAPEQALMRRSSAGWNRLTSDCPAAAGGDAAEVGLGLVPGVGTHRTSEGEAVGVGVVEVDAAVLAGQPSFTRVGSQERDCLTVATASTLMP